MQRTSADINRFSEYGRESSISVSNSDIVGAWNQIRTPWCFTKLYQALGNVDGDLQPVVKPVAPKERYLELAEISGFDGLFNDESTRLVIPNLQLVIETGKISRIPKLGKVSLTYIIGFADWASSW